MDREEWKAELRLTDATYRAAAERREQAIRQALEAGVPLRDVAAAVREAKSTLQRRYPRARG